MDIAEIIKRTSFRYSNEGGHLSKACETAISLCKNKEQAKAVIKEVIKINLPVKHMAMKELKKAVSFIDSYKEKD